MPASEDEPPGLPVAVAIPCYNEAAAIAAVVHEWKAALPAASIVVFDNASSDASAQLARDAGATVVGVAAKGKGNVVRAIFDRLGDRPAVVMIDGDGTYPASVVGPLLNAVLEGRADMAVGARRPEAESGAMSPVRGLGNLLIGGAFRVLIGRGTTDLLSGYRVFGPGYLAVVRPRSSGFEIETELASEAVARGLRVVELPTPYRKRHEGTVSKLSAARDGSRILAMIVRQSCRLRPWRPLVLILSAAIAGICVAGAIRGGGPSP